MCIRDRFVISMYSLSGNDTTGNGSAMISDIMTSPVSAQSGVKPNLTFWEQLPEISHSVVIIKLFTDLFINSFANSTSQVRSLFFERDIDLFSGMFKEIFCCTRIPLPGSSLRVISIDLLPAGLHSVIYGGSLSS